MDGAAIIRDSKRSVAKKTAPVYGRRDLVSMSAVTGLSVALLYTSLWLVASIAG